MITTQQIAASPDLVSDLAGPFDFDLRRSKGDSHWVVLSPAFDFAVLAGDGTGGIFLAYGDGPVEGRPVLYVSSEGSAGRIATNLTEVLGLLIAIPFWQELLTSSIGGVLEKMRKESIEMEEDYQYIYPDLLAARARIVAALSLPMPSDPIRQLHEAVLATDCTAVAKDGRKYLSLFGGY